MMLVFLVFKEGMSEIRLAPTRLWSASFRISPSRTLMVPVYTPA
jgi:hypothetical protein